MTFSLSNSLILNIQFTGFWNKSLIPKSILEVLVFLLQNLSPSPSPEAQKGLKSSPKLTFQKRDILKAINSEDPDKTPSAQVRHWEHDLRRQIKDGKGCGQIQSDEIN